MYNIIKTKLFSYSLILYYIIIHEERKIKDNSTIYYYIIVCRLSFCLFSVLLAWVRRTFVPFAFGAFRGAFAFALCSSSICKCLARG